MNSQLLNLSLAFSDDAALYRRAEDSTFPHSWSAPWASIWSSLRFLFQIEAHVYSFVVAANILISFFPFLVAMIIFCRSALHWQQAVDIILHTVNDYYPKNFGVPFRSYLLLASVSVTAMNVQFLTSRFGTSHAGALLQEILFKGIALPITTVMIFLIYWLLPNTKILVRRLIPASIAVAVFLEASKYLNILTWPWLRAKLRAEVPPLA